MSELDKQYQSTSPKSLRERIMDSRIAKSEAEHWACRTIEDLEKSLEEAVAQIEKAYEDGLRARHPHQLGKVDDRCADCYADGYKSGSDSARAMCERLAEALKKIGCQQYQECIESDFRSHPSHCSEGIAKEALAEYEKGKP